MVSQSAKKAEDAAKAIGSCKVRGPRQQRITQWIHIVSVSVTFRKLHTKISSCFSQRVYFSFQLLKKTTKEREREMKREK